MLASWLPPSSMVAEKKKRKGRRVLSSLLKHSFQKKRKIEGVLKNSKLTFPLYFVLYAPQTGESETLLAGEAPRLEGEVGEGQPTNQNRVRRHERAEGATSTKTAPKQKKRPSLLLQPAGRPLERGAAKCQAGIDITDGLSNAGGGRRRTAATDETISLLLGKLCQFVTVGKTHTYTTYPSIEERRENSQNIRFGGLTSCSLQQP